MPTRWAVCIGRMPNAPAHRPRANDARHATETLSRGSVQPICSALPSQADDIDPPIDCKLTVKSMEPSRATAVMPLHSVDFVTPDCQPRRKKVGPFWGF